MKLSNWVSSDRILTEEDRARMGTASFTAAKLALAGPRLIIPFTRVVANVLNKQLDYTGIGFFRSMWASHFVSDLSGTRFEAKTKDQRELELKRAIVGTTVMTFLLSHTPD